MGNSKFQRQNNWQQMPVYNAASDFTVQRLPTKYCRKCGKQVIMAWSNTDGSMNEYAQWEWDNSMHKACENIVSHEVEVQLKAEMDARVAELNRGNDEELKKKDDSFEAEVERLMKELADKNGRNT